MATALIAVLEAFWRLSTFRLAPQDIPRSSALLALSTLANVVVSLVISGIVGVAAINTGLEMGVLLGMTSALLYAFGRTTRIVQTLTALMGAGTVIGLVVLALLLAFPVLPHLVRIGIFMWNLFVIAHIIRHALDTMLILGCLIAFAYALTLDGLLQLLMT